MLNILTNYEIPCMIYPFYEITFGIGCRMWAPRDGSFFIFETTILILLLGQANVLVK